MARHEAAEAGTAPRQRIRRGEPDHPGEDRHPTAAAILALQRAAGNRAVASFLTRPAAAVQRYTEVPKDGLEEGEKDLGPLMVSDGAKFLRPVTDERLLYGLPATVEEARAVTSGHKSGILDVTAGASRTVLGKEYRQVVVSDRARGGPPRVSASGGASSSSSSSSSASSPPPVEAPFGKFLDLVNTHGRGKLSALLAQINGTPNPFRMGSYAEGAYAAIRTQISLKVDAQMLASPLKDNGPTDREALVRFLEDWQARVAVVNSDDRHRFNFMVTECGGFSQMVSGGAEANQGAVETGGRMSMKFDDALPGPWQNHYASVIMTDGADRATLESAAGMDKWWFGIYGNQNAGQRFIVKTLLAKLAIGQGRGDTNSAEAAAYVNARLRGDDGGAATIGLTLPAGLPAKLDALLAEAARTSVPVVKAAPVIKPGKACQDAVSAQIAALHGLRTRAAYKRNDFPLTADMDKRVLQFTEMGMDAVRDEQVLLGQPDTPAELYRVVENMKAARADLFETVRDLAQPYLASQRALLAADLEKWKVRQNAELQKVYNIRIANTMSFYNTLADVGWARDVAPPAPAPAPTPASSSSGSPPPTPAPTLTHD